jgi:hypothetical protein
MKNIYAFLSLVIFSFGCGSLADLPNFQKTSFNTLEEDKKEFIELNDGTIVEGDISKENLGKYIIIGGKGSVAINGKSYGYKEIIATQKDNKYYRKTVYKDFAERIMKGKINVYRLYRSNYNPEKGTDNSYYLFYLQKGDKSSLDEYDNKLMEKLISDNAAALAKFNKYRSLSGKQKRFKGDGYLNDAIRIYNAVK